MNFSSFSSLYYSKESLGHKMHPTFTPTKHFLGQTNGLGQLCFFLTNSSNTLHHISLSSFPTFLFHSNSLDGGRVLPGWFGLVGSTLLPSLDDCINSAQEAWFFLQLFFQICGEKANVIKQQSRGWVALQNKFWLFCKLQSLVHPCGWELAVDIPVPALQQVAIGCPQVPIEEGVYKRVNERVCIAQP